jgi:hypothetical protein
MLTGDERNRAQSFLLLVSLTFWFGCERGPFFLLDCAWLAFAFTFFAEVKIYGRVLDDWVVLDATEKEEVVEARITPAGTVVCGRSR